MKRLHLISTFLLGMALSTTSFAETPTTQPTPTPQPTQKPQTAVTQVIAIYTGKGEIPTEKTVNAGQTYILVGTAHPLKANTQLNCCVDQYGKVRVPLKNIEQLKKYDISDNGSIDTNETGYYGLFAAKVLPNENFIITPLKDLGIEHINIIENKTPSIELKSKTQLPLVFVTLKPTDK